MCIPDVMRAVAEATIIMVALLLSGGALIALRCVFAAGYYLEDSDDHSLQAILTSDEMWDWDEAEYWIWALVVVLIVWAVILTLLCLYKGLRTTWNFLVDWTWRNVILACCFGCCWVRQQQQQDQLEQHHHYHHYYRDGKEVVEEITEEDKDYKPPVGADELL